jgi:hypothetical protein
MHYYYNNVPGKGQCRNNLIYTSLINSEQTVFCQWYQNDPIYHMNQNTVDSDKMNEKWEREVKYLQLMRNTYPDLVPVILDIDFNNRKIYLEIEGPDFWETSKCTIENYDSVLPDWREQMLNIFKAHNSLGLHKYSMHPSSYFIVDGKLKSINYFFTYHHSEPHITISEVQSHIHENRQSEMRKHLETLDIEWDKPYPFELFDKLCWESFSTNYPEDFIQCMK